MGPHRRGDRSGWLRWVRERAPRGPGERSAAPSLPLVHCGLGDGSSGARPGVRRVGGTDGSSSAVQASGRLARWSPGGPVLSAVVPTLDEVARIGALVHRLVNEVDEVVVSDGGSRDGTTDAARAAGAKVVEGPPGRGDQLDRGAARAMGDVLWFLHADAGVPTGLGPAVRRAAEGRRWGGCRVRIDSRDPRLRWTSMVMNRRAAWTGSFTGDMGVWCRRSLFEEVGGFGGLAALEDLCFSDAARLRAPWALVEPRLGISARRWSEEGVSRTMLRMLAIRAAYRAGLPPGTLARRYRSTPR